MQFKHRVPQVEFSNSSWFTNQELPGGITGIDLAMQNSQQKQHTVSIDSIDNEEELYQNFTLLQLKQLLLRNSKLPVKELVRCDKYMRIFVPVLVKNKLQAESIISVTKALLNKAFLAAFNMTNFDENKCSVRWLTSELLVLVYRDYSVTWNNLKIFWDIIKDVLYAANESSDRMFYHSLFHYKIVRRASGDGDSPGVEVDIPNATFQQIMVQAKHLSLQRLCVLDTDFIQQFAQQSNHCTYFNLPLHSKDNKPSLIGRNDDDTTESLSFKDIIPQKRTQDRQFKFIQIKDLFSAISQTLDGAGLQFISSQWLQYPFDHFLNTGIIALNVGSYCALAKKVNRNKYHQDSQLTLEISMDGALYMRCNVPHAGENPEGGIDCNERLKQLIWKGQNSETRWNIFQDDFDFPEKIERNEHFLTQEIFTFLEQNENVHAITQQVLKKKSRGIADILGFLWKDRIKVTNGGKTVFIWTGSLWKEDQSNDYKAIVSIATTAICDAVKLYLNAQMNSIVAGNPVEVGKKKKKSPQESKIEKEITRIGTISDKVNDGSTYSIEGFLCPMLYDETFLSNVNYHPYYFAGANGMVNLKTSCLEGFHPSFYLTDSSQYDFHPCSCPIGQCTMDYRCDSQCDMTYIHQTIKQIMGYDVTLYNHFRWILGYALVGDPKKKLLPIGQGPQYNGKSLVSNFIIDILPMYTRAMEKSVVIDTKQKQAGAASPEMVHLNGIRLAILNETGERDRLNEDQVKSITGGGTEKKCVRQLNQKNFDMELRFVPFMFTNFAPKMSLNDDALWNRIVPVLFPVTFTANPDPNNPGEQPMNEDLNKILRQPENKVKMFNWLIRCCVYYCQNENKPYPQRIQAKLDEYKMNCNTLVQYLEQNAQMYKKDQNSSVDYGMFRDDFDKYCSNRFTKALRSKFVEPKYFDMMIKKMGLTIKEKPNKGREIIGLKSTDFSIMPEIITHE